MSDEKWLFFTLARQRYGISVRFVREMCRIRREDIRHIPQAPPHVVGVICRRGSVLPLIDVRKLLGMTSMSEETAGVLQLLRDRERDHVNWLTELRAAVDESRPFKLATDPHKCAFGKWYDALLASPMQFEELTNGDPELSRNLRAFDAPHQAIHGIAQKVMAMMANQDATAARELITRTRDTTLARMIGLFEECRQQIAELRQSLMVEVEHQGQRTGLLVDAVENVTEIDAACVDTDTPLNNSNPAICGFLASREHNGQPPTTLLNLDALLQGVTA